MSARILIIEDEALVAMDLRLMLEDLGHEVVATVADAQTARAVAHEEQVDLAMVDIHLSDGPTGITIGRELAQDHGVTVMFLTGNPGMVRDGVAGVIGVMGKPIDDRLVSRAVAFALARREGIHDLPAPPALRLFA